MIKPSTLPWWLSGLLALLLLWQLIALFFYHDELLDAPTPLSTQNLQAKPLDYDNIARFNPTPAGSDRQSVINAPKTSLKLRLVGLMYSPTPELARAIIEKSKADGKSYKVGDEVAANTEISSIEVDRVVLLRNGRHETLLLEKPVPGGSPETKPSVPSAVKRLREASRAAPPAPPAPPMNHDITLRKSTSRYLKQATNSLTELNRHFLATPVRDADGVRGFKLQALKRRGLLREVGLEADDVITEINGKSLNNPLDVALLYNDLKNTDSLDLTVERNGSSFNVKINLAQQ